MKKRRIGLIVLLGLIFLSFFAYKHLFPKGPILDEVPNPVRDRATHSKSMDESSIPSAPLKQAFFGDLHVHTNLSFDAYIGGTHSSPSDAYRFAKGETVNLIGKKVKTRRPLDFAAITDHAEFIGELLTTQDSNEKAHGALASRVLRWAASDRDNAQIVIQKFVGRREPGFRQHMGFFQGYETTKRAWDIILEAAESHYEPGKFTTLAGYEWSLTEVGGHLHRNVIFRDMVVPDYPISALEARDVPALWKSLERFQSEGATVMAIPHNTNLSLGRSFNGLYPDGSPIDSAYAKKSNRWEPLVEIHQSKGSSEVHPTFWKNDEYSDFETHTFLPEKESSYVRYGLKKGLEYEEKLGTNPFKYGLIASTDTHSANPGDTEEDWSDFGNHAVLDSSAQSRLERDWILKASERDTFKVYQVVNPGGLVAVWAEKNTRSSIYDALARKETYATSGGRIQVRFFGAYDFDKKYDSYEDLVQAGYDKGVPMGSDLESNAEAPSFLIWASKDPESANLERIQVIKGWYKDGQLEEQIFDVAVAKKIGGKVNLNTGEWDKSTGANSLQTVWTDPNFDAQARAFYYVRVLEVPTARWTLWDKINSGIDFPEGTKMTVQERAWSSPIWYSPE